MPEGLTPEYWTNKEDIPDEVFEKDGMVVCRTRLNGHSGDGIVLARNRLELVDCNLYVRYVKKAEEYRVHVGKGCSIISLQKKMRRLDAENPNFAIRNHQNGFIYAREGVDPPEGVITAACSSLDATGLDFGAVDVIWNNHYSKAYVLEINTAPGLAGTTVTDYCDYFLKKDL
jgi:hypothetical protein